MFGHNTPRGHEGSNKGYQVHKVFYTIQGEGPFAGLPAVFVRLTGCNLRCHWCDTEWHDDADAYQTPEQILDAIRKESPTCKLVVLTGGEPCRWDLQDLIELLAKESYQVQVETAGTLWQQCLLDPCVTIVVSPKIKTVHTKFYDHCQHWKYVVSAGDADPKDGLPVAGTQRRQGLASSDALVDGTVHVGGAMARPPSNRRVNVYLQPCDEKDESKNRANIKHMVQIALRYGYRAGLQLHKIFDVE